MSEKKTLQAFLSPRRLRELAGPKVYARGEEYYAGDSVQLHEHTHHEAIGEVAGSQPYRVELKLTSKGLIAECTCPAMSDYGFCKHAVALGLHLVDAPPPTAKRTVKAQKVAPDEFTIKYPNIAGWIKDGWIEIGRDGHSTSTIRVLDEGGLVWEGGTRHKSIAVGTPITERPPHRTVRAEFRIRLPPWVFDGEAVAWPWMKDARFREPVVC